MHVLIITFRLRGLDPAGYARLAGELAPELARVPGLTGAIWLAGRATNTCGGIYLFRDRRALDRYFVADAVRSWAADPRLIDFTIQTFDTIEAATRMTQGDLAIYPPAKAA